MSAAKSVAANGTRARPVECLPVGGRIGAEIRGVTLSDELDDATMETIRAHLLRWKVIFFRDQNALDDAGQEIFAERLGAPIKHPIAPAAAGSRFLLDLKASEGYAASHWHTDMTFMPAYPAASILRPLILPDHGGDTLWANTAAAYEHLPAPLKLLAENLRAIHSNDYDYAAQFDAETWEKLGVYRDLPTPKKIETEHPVVRVHPETGERTLLLGGFFKRFVGLSGADSQLLFAIFQDHVTKPENTVRWRWRLGDVAVWDNRATQHRAIADYGDQPRNLRRATIHGDAPVGVDGRESRPLNPQA